MIPNSRRVVTSKISERAAGCSEPVVRSHAPSLGWPVTRRVRRCCTRDLRKMRLATPVAAMTSTEISPRVSQARVSTRMTLTMFLP